MNEDDGIADDDDDDKSITKRMLHTLMMVLQVDHIDVDIDSPWVILSAMTTRTELM